MMSLELRMARTNCLYKLTENGLIVGGAVLFRDKEFIYYRKKKDEA